MSTSTGVTEISAATRATLAAIADVLIPAAHGMPAAGEVGVAEAQLDRVLRARPDLAEPLQRGLDALAPTGAGEALRALERLEGQDAEAHGALLTTIVGGYYIHPEVRRRLRYDGQEPREVRPEIIPNYVDEGLLDGVVERGSIFRPISAKEEEESEK
jgi:hypothetical protein